MKSTGPPRACAHAREDMLIKARQKVFDFFADVWINSPSPAALRHLDQLIKVAEEKSMLDQVLPEIGRACDQIREKFGSGRIAAKWLHLETFQLALSNYHQTLAYLDANEAPEYLN